jgi:putative ABC transport system permease protein
MVRSLSRLIATDPGFRAEQVLTSQLALPRLAYGDQAPRIAFIDAVLARLAATPGASAVAIAAYLPFSGDNSSSPFEIVGRTQLPDADRPHANFNIVSDDYFRAMGVTLRAGRAFTATDQRGSPPVVMIDQRLADEYFPGESPIGKHVRQLGGLGDGDPVIVGVVASVKQETLAKADKATIYYSYRQTAPPGFSVVLRGVLPPATFAGAVRSAVAAQDRQIPVFDVRAMRERVDESLGAQRLAVWVLGAFATLALTLALLGITGVLSYTVSQRLHEMGVRLALGAQRQDIARLVVGQGARLTAFGLVAGVIAFLALGSALRSVLFGVGPRDPATIFGATALLASVALVASWLPARRASRADAATVLRRE